MIIDEVRKTDAFSEDHPAIDYHRIAQKLLLKELEKCAGEVAAIDSFGNPALANFVPSGTAIYQTAVVLAFGHVLTLHSSAASEVAFYSVPNTAVFLTARSEKESAKDMFRRLASQWKRETMHMSSLRRRIEHSSYRSIIDMGDDAVPFILYDLKISHDDWSPALESITGEHPVPVSAYGKAKEVAKAWLRWAKESGRSLPAS